MKETKNLEKDEEEKPRQRASCRLEDEDEVKDKRSIKKGGGERHRELEWKDPTSRVAPITGTFRSQVLQKTLAAVPSISSPLFPWLLETLSSPSLLHPLTLFLFFFSFLFSILSYDPSGVTIGEVLPAVSFSSVCKMLSLNNQGAVRPLRSIKVLFVPFCWKGKTSVILSFYCFGSALNQSITKES